jgi:hypothetical protein
VLVQTFYIHKLRTRSEVLNTQVVHNKYFKKCSKKCYYSEVSHEILLANANTAILTQSYLVHSCFCTITVLGFPVSNYAFKNVTTLAGTLFGSKNCIYDLHSKDIRRKPDYRDCVYLKFSSFLIGNFPKSTQILYCSFLFYSWNLSNTVELS